MDRSVGMNESEELMSRLGGPETYEVVVHESTSDIHGRIHIAGLVPDDFLEVQQPSIIEAMVTEVKTQEPWHIVIIQLCKGDVPKVEMKVQDDRNYGSLRMTVETGWGGWNLGIIFAESRKELTSYVKLRLTKRIWR